jgi:hypothetical protein
MVISGETARKEGMDQHPPEAMLWLPEAGIVADFEMFQGYCFPDPAWKMYFWTGKDRTYLAKLYRALERHDGYLWRTRDSNGDGLLETWCVWDTGEDSSTRFETRHVPMRWPSDLPPGGNPKVLAPIASMDIMAYSYAGRATLARIAHELGNGREEYWRQQAEDVRQRLMKGLWDPARHACFDRDRTGKVMPELVHNNLRAMYFGVFNQEMADAFIKYHLLNPDEFWTPLPLPSIAVHEPLYRNIPGNNWSGQPQGLTYQRAIRALENYSHFAEVSLLGDKFLKVLIRNGNKLVQQYDAISGKAAAQTRDGYGPTILAALEYISRMYGISLEVEQGQVWWSGLNNAGPDFTYTQQWGDRLWKLSCERGQLTAYLNGSELFSCTAGVRVVTDLEGRLREVVGIDSVQRAIELRATGKRHELTVSPNQVYAIGAEGMKFLRKAPFDYPMLPGNGLK